MAKLLTRGEMQRRLEQAFPPGQVTSLVEVLDPIREMEIQRAADTRELTQGLTALTEEVKHLAVAQRNTEEEMAEFRKVIARNQEEQAEFRKVITRNQEVLAEHSSAIRGLREEQAEFRKVVARNQEVLAEHSSAIRGLQEQQAEHSSVIRGLQEQQAELSQAIRSNQEHLAELSGEIRGLREDQTELRRAFGSLANTFGFSLEEFVAALLPPYLARHYGITDLALERRYFDLGDGRVEEVDLVGDGIRDGRPVTVLAECRATVGGSEVRRLADKLEAVIEALGEGEMRTIIVAMNIHPTAAEAGQERGVWMIPYSHINRERG